MSYELFGLFVTEILCQQNVDKDNVKINDVLND